ncbi:hypothetical protein GCM10009550_38860 [Actinocorallia libanotica]|uniref:Transposase n=1 Tax=Actinocorallia libanotica TaxID=46162 RepID=A0ABP4BWL2_9ACTN
MARGDVTDEEWALIEPYLPLGERGPIPDLRRWFNAVIWRFRTGSPWRGVPEHYGSWSTVYDRFRVWAVQGVMEHLLEQMIGLAADLRCRPLSFVLAPGQSGDGPQFRAVLSFIKVRGPVGRPRTRPAAVAADEAYSSRADRSHLRGRGIRAVIPEKADQAANRKNKGSRGGRPVSHVQELYRERNTVERCINKIKQWRGPATRYDKSPRVTWPACISAEPFSGSAEMQAG